MIAGRAGRGGWGPPLGSGLQGWGQASPNVVRWSAWGARALLSSAGKERQGSPAVAPADHGNE